MSFTYSALHRFWSTNWPLSCPQFFIGSYVLVMAENAINRSPVVWKDVRN